jgi:hypothetical protein
MTSSDFHYKIVFLTGVDGSGKTYFTKKLIEILQAKGIPAIHVWSRFNNFLSKPLLALTRLIGLNYYENMNGVKVGYHDFHKSKIISFFFILCQLFDVWIASIIKFWIPLLKKKSIIVADRGPHDTLIDVALDTGRKSLPKSSLGKLYLKAIPFSHKVLFVRRDAGKIESMRPDIKLDRKFKERLQLYLENEKNLNFFSIDNNGTPEETLSMIVNELFHK